MNFLAPLFLLGAAAIALPVAFHLIRRNTRRKLNFSSLLFLQSSPPRMRERSRLEDLLLLLLRCLVLGLLAFAFSRPFFKRADLADPISGTRERVLVLLDISASMQRPGLWDAAVARVLHHVRQAKPADVYAVSAFGRESTPVVSFEAWSASTHDARVALVQERLRPLRPGWSSTHLATALINAAEALGESPDEKQHVTRRIVLVTDLQEGSRLEALQGYDWPKGITLNVDTLPAPPRGNAGLQLLTDAAVAPGATQAVVRVRVLNASDSREDRFELGWARPGDASPSLGIQEVRVAPGGNRVVALPVPSEPGLDRIVLRGDGEPFDNTLYLVPPSATGARILYVGTESPADAQQPLFFLRRVFAETNGVAATLAWRTPATLQAAEDLAAASVAILAAPLPPAALASARDRLQAGGVVVHVPPAGDDGATLAGLLGLPGVPLVETRLPGYALLAEIDFKHPLLAPFADPRYSDFTKVRIWRYRKLDPAALPHARVITRLDSGDPLWLEVPVGRGRLLVLASGWHPADSQLALSSKFVPLLYSILDGAGAQTAAHPALAVGDVLAPPEAVAAASPVTLRSPDGRESRWPEGTNALAPHAATATAALPGIYVFSSAAASVRVAVNLDATESRTAPLPVDDLEKLGATLKSSELPPPPDPEARRQLAAAESENRQKLWRWFLAGTLFFVLLETTLAGWLTRRTLPPAIGGTPA